MKKEELIDFFLYLMSNSLTLDWNSYDGVIDAYLESINSTSNEVLTLSNNEAKEKVCVCLNTPPSLLGKKCPICGDLVTSG